MPAKPRGKAKGSKSQSRRSREDARKASVSRGLMKDRIAANTAEIKLLRVLHEALVSEIREMMQGTDSLIPKDKQL